MNARNGQMGQFPQGGRGIPNQQLGGPNLAQQDLTSGSLLQSQLQAQSQNPQQQKQMLGEVIFPKIAAIQPELAGKITGMLLEMDNTELVNLIEDDGALRAKVEEAMAVYDEYVKAQAGSSEVDGEQAKKEDKSEEKA